MNSRFERLMKDTAHLDKFDTSRLNSADRFGSPVQESFGHSRLVCAFSATCINPDVRALIRECKGN